MDVSIILPCFNEAQVLGKAVSAIRNTLDKTIYKYEIIIAEDASTDGSDKIAKELSQRYENIIWLHRDNKRGRGSAVSNAIRKARGRIVGFIDVDLETPAHYIYPAIIEIDNGADIATCIRIFKLGINQLFFRFPKVLSHYCYLWLSRKILGMKLTDIEAGFKFFNKERILPILDEINDEHWFWDTELMARSYYKNYKIVEKPMLFLPNYQRRSKVNLVEVSLDYIRKLLKFRKIVKHLRESSYAKFNKDGKTQN